MSTSQPTKPPAGTPALIPPSQHRSQTGFHWLGLFNHHGAWGPGVRLFRQLGFPAKVVVMAAVFLVPTVILGHSYWTTANQVIESTIAERNGVAALERLLPVQHALVDARGALRARIAGLDTAADYQATRQRMDAALAALGKHVQQSGDPLHIAGSLQAVSEAWAATASSATGLDESGSRMVLRPTVDAVNALWQRIGANSRLMLDPEVDSSYVTNAFVMTMPDTIEYLALIIGWSNDAAARGEETDHLETVNFSVSLVEAMTAKQRAYLQRAVDFNPALQGRLNAAPLDHALAYVADAQQVAQGHKTAARAHVDRGAQVSAGLIAFTATGLKALDGVLAERIAAARAGTYLRAAIVVGFLALAGYFFRCFYLVMDGGIRETERHLVAMTQGDLTTTPRPWGKDEPARLMFTLASLQSSLREMVGQVRATSDAVLASSAAIAENAINLSARTESAAASLQQTAASMEQITATVRQSADGAGEAARLARENAGVAQQGGEVIGEVVSTMQQINQSSKRIGDIIGTIDGIAFQTNILALNAAVEAARAGEQGRGFAVVAGEVRNLAQSSAGAAREIKALIQDSVGRVDAGAQVVEGAGRTMVDIVERAQLMSGIIGGISTSASEQNAGIGQIGAAVQSLDEMTQQNAALVQQSTSAAAELKEQAQILAERVARFSLPTAS
jgi:methyl-accepting chemotaxis protein